MKKFLRFLFLLSFIGGGLLACSDDTTTEPEPEPTPTPPTETISLEAEFVSSTYSSITIDITAEGLTEYAYQTYLASESSSAPDPAVLFAAGTTGTLGSGKTNLTITDYTDAEGASQHLDAATKYRIYIAGRNEKGIHETVFKLDATTADMPNELTIYDVTHNSARAHVPFTPKYKDNVIKYVFIDALTYNYQSVQYTDAEMMNLSDEIYHNYITEDTDFIFDEEHSIIRDENGNPVMDEYGESPLTRWGPCIPGQPNYLILGEYAYGEHPWGFGEGYYKALFDTDAYLDATGGGWGPWSANAPRMTRADEVDQADFWEEGAYYVKEPVSMLQPEKFPTDLQVDESLLRPNGGILQIKVPAGITYVCYTLMEEYTWEQVKQMFLNNDESLMQWAITSYNGSYLLPAFTVQMEDPTRESLLTIDVGEFFYDLTPDMKYYLFATGLNDNTATKQNYVKHEFTLPAPTKPAPTVVVTAIDAPAGAESDPYDVWFNVKCTTGDAYEAIYACNYEREWQSQINSGYYTHTSLIQFANHPFGAQEIAQMNSPEGYNMKFSSRPDAVTRLGVIAYNDEGTGNDPDNDPQAMATQRSAAVPDKARVESSLFTELQGDWTLTVNYQNYDYNTQGWSDAAEPIVAKVTITDHLSYEATLPESVYTYYAQNTQYTRDEVTALYEDFKDLVDLYNERLRGQNRLLCLGLQLEPKSEWGEKYDYLAGYKTAYDLFIATSEDYSGYDNEAILFDFGPKWFIEIGEDDVLTAPFDVTTMAPLTAWKSGSTYYLVGVTDDVLEIGNFPVTLSADKQTLTVNGCTSNGKTYYPNAGRPGYGGTYNFYNRNIQPLTLTKGWTEPASKANATTRKSPANTKPAQLQGSNAQKAVCPKSRTSFSTLPATKIVKPTAPKESLQERAEKYFGPKRSRR